MNKFIVQTRILQRAFYIEMHKPLRYFLRFQLLLLQILILITCPLNVINVTFEFDGYIFDWLTHYAAAIMRSSAFRPFTSCTS